MIDKKKIVSIVATTVAIMIVVVVFLLIKNAKAMYQVSFFDTEGGKLVGVQQIQKGKCVTKPEDPTMEGNKFLGWYLGEEKFDFSTPIKSNYSLIAKWQFDFVPISTIYNITLNVDGTTTTDKTDENGLIQEPEAPIKKGYTFIGWFIDDEKVDFTKPFTEDAEIVAKWEKEVEPEKQTKEEVTKKENVKKVRNKTTIKQTLQTTSENTQNDNTQSETTTSNISNDNTPSENAASNNTSGDNTPSGNAAKDDTSGDNASSGSTSNDNTSNGNA